MIGPQHKKPKSNDEDVQPVQAPIAAKNSSKLQKNATISATAQKDKEASIIIDDEDKDSDDDKKEMDDAEKSMETKSIVELNKLDKNAS